MPTSETPVESISTANAAFLPYICMLEDQPYETLDRVAKLWVAQKGSIVDEDGDLCRIMITLSFCYSGYVGFSIDPRDEPVTFPKPDGDVWRAVLASKLPTCLLDIIQDAVFLEQPISWKQAVIDMTAAISYVWINHARPQAQVPVQEGHRWLHVSPALAEEYLLKLKPAFSIIWNSLDTLLLPLNPDRPHGIAFDLTTFAYSAMVLYVQCYAKQTSEWTWMEYMPIIQVALRAWMDICSDSPELQAQGAHIFTFNATKLYRIIVSKGAARNFDNTWRAAIDASLEGVGPSGFMHTCLNVLSSNISLTGASLQSCLESLQEMLVFTSFHDPKRLKLDVPIRKAFWGQHMLRAIADALERQSCDVGESTPLESFRTSAGICTATCHLMQFAQHGFLGYLEDIPPPVLDGRSGYRILSSCFLLLGRALEVQHSLKLETKTDTDAVHRAVTALTSTCKAWFQMCLDGNSGTKVMKAAVTYRIAPDTKAAASEAWYDDMRSLRSRRERLSGEGDYEALVRSWTAFGKAMGLEETAERDRYNKSNKHMCSWVMCKFYLEPSPTPLSTCKGCGEQKYCSRECQKIDWKQGGHRDKCRRLAAA